MNKIFKNKAKSKTYHLTIAENPIILAVCGKQYALPGKTSLRSLVHTVGIKCGLVGMNTFSFNDSVMHLYRKLNAYEIVTKNCKLSIINTLKGQKNPKWWKFFFIHIIKCIIKCINN